jgi:hypothetical protein
MDLAGNRFKIFAIIVRRRRRRLHRIFLVARLLEY